MADNDGDGVAHNCPVRSLRVPGLILLFTLVVRLPFFFPAVVDWDESTFILIGQSILNGHLPYVHLWDLKPPLLFAFFSAAIALFGHSIVGVRIAGALCVATTAWFVYLIALRWGSRSAAWLAAALCIVVSSLISSGQATMSEHVMLPVVMGAVYLWLRGPRSARTNFWVGALMAVATLIRLNMAAGVITFGIVIGVEAATRRTSVWRPLFGYATGGLAVLVVTGLPFAVAGRLGLLWTSVVLAALARSDPAGAAVPHAMEWLLRLLRGGREGAVVLPIGTFLWLSGVAGLLIAGSRRRAGDPVPAGLGLLLALGSAVAVSIAMSGGTYSHYLIQAVPFAAIFAAALVRHSGRRARAAILMLAAALTVLSLRPVVDEYRRMAARIGAGEELSYGPAVDIASYLSRENPDARTVLLLTDHLAYWLLNSEPPVGLVTHPSVLSRDAVLAVMGTSAVEQLEAMLQRAPEFVVFDPDEPFLDGEIGLQLQEALTRDYRMVTLIGGRAVYRREVVAR